MLKEDEERRDKTVAEGIMLLLKSWERNESRSEAGTVEVKLEVVVATLRF